MHKVSLIPVTVPVRSQRTYVVQQGDTPRTIAMAFYRNPLMARALIANNLDIVPGRTILIP